MGNTSHQRPKDLTLLPLNSSCTKSLDPQTQWELLACASLIMNLVWWNWTSSRSKKGHTSQHTGVLSFLKSFQKLYSVAKPRSYRLMLET
jgi:hypothetical protein